MLPEPLNSESVGLDELVQGVPQPALWSSVGQTSPTVQRSHRGSDVEDHPPKSLYCQHGVFASRSLELDGKSVEFSPFLSLPYTMIGYMMEKAAWLGWKQVTVSCAISGCGSHFPTF